jgi:hypothetical protein
MCQHPNSVGSFNSTTRICLDCGSHWLLDTGLQPLVERLQQEWLEYYSQTDEGIREGLDSWDIP